MRLPNACRRWALLLACVATLMPSPARAQEQEEILSFDVVVDIQPDGRLVMVEDITVRALGNEIRRGIYRDFPTSFPRASGLGRIEAPFQVTQVLKNGAPEPYKIESIGGPLGRGGVRVRIGNADLLLDAGVYTYTIRYETQRWLVFGDEVDELYWNVTGNGWAFPIASASARVFLPGAFDPDDLGFEAWTGPEGSTESAARWRFESAAGASGAAFFETTARLEPEEGLTIRLTFPKGAVPPPSPELQAEWFRLDWGGYVDAGYVLLLIVALYLLMWHRVGRDPERGPVVVQYEPPPGFSPAALGYLKERGFDTTLLSATLVSLAVKGAVTLEKKGSKWYVHRTTEAPGELSADEERVLFELLHDRRTLALTQSHRTELKGTLKALKGMLSKRLESHYFVLNRRWFAAGLILSLMLFAALTWRTRFSISPAAWFLGVWLTGWTAGVSTLVWRVLKALRQGLTTGGLGNWFEAIFLGLFSIPFVGAELVVGTIFMRMVPTHIVLAAVAVGAVNVLFYHLLERPTLKGQGVLRHLEGFRTFLGATDGDRLDRMLPADRTPELFERYLPHAIALGVENKWADRFEGVLSAGMAGDSAYGGGGFTWYAGASTVNLGGIASSLGGSLSSSLSSASSPPSGGGSGGGGGSSGGGGGGGGGGGW